jgi:hypothetical protein
MVLNGLKNDPEESLINRMTDQIPDTPLAVANISERVPF